MTNNFKTPEEWFKQSTYDFNTAKAMFDAGRYIYTIFMCHLCVEKALKGLHSRRNKKTAPKTHDLIYLCEKININPTDKIKYFLDELNDLSVPTRYPDELGKLLKEYRKDKTKVILQQTKELLSWLKTQLLEQK